jgi:hypothetical protein
VESNLSFVSQNFSENKVVADWFALMNNKMGGDLKKINVVGDYLIEVWKAIGMDLDKVEFKKSSEIINEVFYHCKII